MRFLDLFGVFREMLLVTFPFIKRLFNVSIPDWIGWYLLVLGLKHARKLLKQHEDTALWKHNNNFPFYEIFYSSLIFVLIALLTLLDYLWLQKKGFHWDTSLLGLSPGVKLIQKPARYVEGQEHWCPLCSGSWSMLPFACYLPSCLFLVLLRFLRLFWFKLCVLCLLPWSSAKYHHCSTLSINHVFPPRFSASGSCTGYPLNAPIFRMHFDESSSIHYSWYALQFLEAHGFFGQLMFLAAFWP